jgi:hypothetical protein
MYDAAQKSVVRKTVPCDVSLEHVFELFFFPVCFFKGKHWRHIACLHSTSCENTPPHLHHSPPLKRTEGQLLCGYMASVYLSTLESKSRHDTALCKNLTSCILWPDGTVLKSAWKPCTFHMVSSTVAPVMFTCACCGCFGSISQLFLGTLHAIAFDTEGIPPGQCDYMHGCRI